jgi:lipopolysaccharide export system protein LptC
MASKHSSESSHLSHFVRVAEHPSLTIYSEHGETTTIYDPKNEADIHKLCKAANLDEFIKDKENVTYPHLLIFESNRYARGVIANEAIKKNQIICEYLGEMASLEKMLDRERVTKIVKKELSISLNAKDMNYFEQLDKAIDAYIKQISAYAFELTRKSGPNDCMLAHKKRSLAAFINHQTTDPNVHVDIKNQSIRFIASRNIFKGEQLRIDYGPDYEYEEHMSYIPNTDNHLRRGKFLAEHIGCYHLIPFALKPHQKKALGTEFNHLMVPLFIFQLLKNKKIKHFTQYDKYLPPLEVFNYSKKNLGHEIYIPEHQQNITPLLLACALKNKIAIKKLIEDPDIDIFSKTIQDKDALMILLNSVKSEKMFLQLSKPLLKILAKNVKRIDYLGSDQNKSTALHIIIERNWYQSIKWFNHKVFFSVVDTQDYDPLMLAIARGKKESLKALFKLVYVKKHIKSLLLIREDINDHNHYVLKRALQDTPKKYYNDISKLILQAVKKNNAYEKIRLLVNCA